MIEMRKREHYLRNEQNNEQAHKQTPRCQELRINVPVRHRLTPAGWLLQNDRTKVKEIKWC